MPDPAPANVNRGAAPAHADISRAEPRPRDLRYLRLGDLPHCVANNVVHAMEASLAKLDLRHKVAPRNAAWDRAALLLSRIGLVRAIARPGRIAYLVPAGGCGESRFFPVTYVHEVVPWIFDAWPKAYPRIERALRRQRVRLAFFTARQSADYFRGRTRAECVWVPEACDPSVFDPSKPLAARSVDVLELGRRHDGWHDAVANRLAELGRVHLYEKVKGQLIFPTEAAMRGGYNDAKVSVCFPSSVTHPARAGDVETVTLRYFESMAAGCLIVGQCPGELRDVMGYDPVIAANLSSPAAAAGQVADLLADVGRYQELADRNYRALLARGSWDVRIASLMAELAARGYRPQPRA